MTEEIQQSEEISPIEKLRANASAIARGEEIPYQATEQEQGVAEAEEDDSANEAEKVDDDLVEAGDDTEAEEATEEEKKPRKKSWGEREREKRLQAEAALDDLNKKMQALQSRLDKLDAPKQDAPAKEEDEDEPLDPVHYAKLEGKLEQYQFQSAITSADFAASQKIEGWNDIKEQVLASHAQDIFYDQTALGNNITPEEAMQYAAAKVTHDLGLIHKKGGDIARYFLTRHAAVKDRFEQKKPAKQEEKKGVDLKKLDELRKSAGAPTNKSALSEVDPQDGITALRAEAKRIADAAYH